MSWKKKNNLVFMGYFVISTWEWGSNVCKEKKLLNKKYFHDQMNVPDRGLTWMSLAFQATSLPTQLACQVIVNSVGY